MGFLLSFLARRLAQGLLIVLLVSFGIFAILRLVPGDPVRMILGPMANAAAIEDAAKSLGLRDPIPIQYFHCTHVVRGDLGTSFSKGKGGQSFARADQQSNSGKAQVSDLLRETVPMTLQLAGLALVFTALISLPLGIAAGLNPGRIPDKLAFYVGSIFVSVPNFWCALVLVLIVSAQLNLLPAIGYQGSPTPFYPRSSSPSNCRRSSCARLLSRSPASRVRISSSSKRSAESRRREFSSITRSETLPFPSSICLACRLELCLAGCSSSNTCSTIQASACLRFRPSRSATFPSSKAWPCYPRCCSL